jgi:AcrR family transcriptional regulator
VAEKGYAAATVADAVRLARVSRGTFYALFESKEACLAAAYRLGQEVLAARVSDAVRDAGDWREELRLGLRAYLQTFDAEPLFARVYLLEWAPVPTEREDAIRRFARRYGRTFARAGVEVPEQALYLLAAGVHELARAHVRAGGRATELEDVLVGCAMRLASDSTVGRSEEPEPWT